MGYRKPNTVCKRCGAFYVRRHVCGDRPGKSLRGDVASTRGQIRGEDISKSRRCQRCDRQLPPQRLGRPRKYCHRCAAGYTPPPAGEWAKEQAERLRAGEAAAKHRSEAHRHAQGDGASNPRDLVRRPPAASGAITYGGLEQW